MALTSNEGTKKGGELPVNTGVSEENTVYQKDKPNWVYPIRPNLNICHDWFIFQALRNRPLARLCRIGYNACSTLLGRNNPLSQIILNAYNHCIEPSHKSIHIKRPCVDHSQSMVD